METFKFNKEEVLITKIQKTLELSLAEYIGERLREIRKSRGMNQAQVGLLTNMLRTTISNIEQGRIQITCDQMCRLCKVYECRSIDILPF